MQFSTLLAGAAALACAQAVMFTNPSFATAKIGQPFNITWTDAAGPVTLLLKNGPPNALVTVDTIASGLDTTSFTWTPSASLPSDTYAIEINDGGAPNYSTQFQLFSSSTATASGSSNSTTTTTSSTAPTGGSNSTVTPGSPSGTTSSSSSRTSPTTPAASTSAPGTGSAAGIASPLAMVLLAFAAVMTLN